MKKITLKHLYLDNFAGSGKHDQEFDEELTKITEKNGWGKTRLLNAFVWLLFDKNGDDRKVFNIKNTKDTSLNRKDHTVYAMLDIDGQPLELKKIYREKWVKKHGAETQERNGHETIYEFNGLPCSKKDYVDKINSIVNEELFKLLTNVQYFNSLHWQKQRDIIFELVPEVTDEEVSESNPKFKKLLESLTFGATLDQYKKGINAKKEKVNRELKEIPIRINQEITAKPDQDDFDAIESEIKEKEAKVKAIDAENESTEVARKALSDKSIAIQNNINQLESKVANKKHTERLSFNELSNKRSQEKQKCRNEVDRLEKQEKEINQSIKDKTSKLKNLEEYREHLISSFKQTNALEFSKDGTECEFCGAPLSKEKLKTAEEDFAVSKTKRLLSINDEGASMKIKRSEIEQSIKDDGIIILELNETITKEKQYFLELNKLESIIEPDFTKDEEIVAWVAEISKHKEALANQKTPNKAEVDNSKNELLSEIKSLNSRLHNKQVIDNADKRIEDLEAEEKRLAQEVSGFESIENTIDKFEIAKIEANEKKINDKFQFVKFRLVKPLENGGEEQTCEAMVDGVPFKDANTAGKINAGLDIINTLSDFYGIHAPVFVDNSESVTNIIKTNNQLICLGVK